MYSSGSLMQRKGDLCMGAASHLICLVDSGHAAAGVKELASDSLELLREFLYDERFPALFDLELYGSIIGMFELNNLSTPLLPTCSCRMLKSRLFAAIDTGDSRVFLQG